MNEEIKRRWVEALRSGEYQQTTETLHDVHGYCCLGVLCDLVDPSQWITSTVPDEYIYNGESAELPSSVSDQVGLDNRDPELTVRCRYCDGTGTVEYQIPCINCAGDGIRSLTLSSINDDGYTFQQIADAIEAQL